MCCLCSSISWICVKANIGKMLKINFLFLLVQSGLMFPVMVVYETTHINNNDTGAPRSFCPAAIAWSLNLHIGALAQRLVPRIKLLGAAIRGRLVSNISKNSCPPLAHLHTSLDTWRNSDTRNLHWWHSIFLPLHPVLLSSFQLFCHSLPLNFLSLCFTLLYFLLAFFHYLESV